MLNRICDGAAVSYGDPDRLVVLFSSVLAVPRDHFDYADITRDLPYTKLFLRDHQPLLTYHTGIRGLSGSIHETAEFLRYFIDRLGPGRVTFMGISSGGYAANLLGHWVGADDVHLQSTVSFTDPAVRDAVGGGERIPGSFDSMAAFMQEHGLDPALMDLRRIIADHDGPAPLVRLYYPSGDAIDVLQAGRIADFPHVQAIAHPSRSHSFLGAALARAGILYDDLAASVQDLRAQHPTGNATRADEPA